MSEVGSKTSWQDRLYDTLRARGVTIFSYVPDAGHKIVINRSLEAPEVISVPLTSEQEGVALAVGAHLGGAKSVLLLQSSGVGNCVNMLAMIQSGRFPFLAIVSMRGDYGEENPWQFPMGQAAQPALEAMGVIVYRVDREDDVVPTINAAIVMGEKSDRAVAVLLGQKLVGTKAF